MSFANSSYPACACARRSYVIGTGIHLYVCIRECGSTLFVKLQHADPPTNTKFKPLLLPTQAGIPYTNIKKHRTSYFKSTLTFLGPAKHWKSISSNRQIREFLAVLHHYNQRVQSTTLCRDGTPSSAHQYKLPDIFSTNLTSKGSL